MRGTAAEAAAYTSTVDERLAAMRGKPADKTLPAGTTPTPEPVRTLADLRDPDGERLRVEEDRRDGRRYLTVGEPDAERPFELVPGAAGVLFGALCDLDTVPGGKAVKHGSPAVKQGTGYDTRAALIGEALRLLHGLDLDDLRVRVRLLEQGSFEQVKSRCVAITEAAREPALTPNNYRPTPADHNALALHLSTLRAWRLIVLGPGKAGR